MYTNAQKCIKYFYWEISLMYVKNFIKSTFKTWKISINLFNSVSVLGRLCFSQLLIKIDSFIYKNSWLTSNPHIAILWKIKDFSAAFKDICLQFCNFPWRNINPWLFVCSNYFGKLYCNYELRYLWMLSSMNILILPN